MQPEAISNPRLKRQPQLVDQKPHTGKRNISGGSQLAALTGSSSGREDFVQDFLNNTQVNHLALGTLVLVLGTQFTFESHILHDNLHSIK